MQGKTPKRGTVSGAIGEEEVAEHLQPHKPAGGEPVQDEEMFDDPLTQQIHSGDDAENPPSGG